MSAKEDSDINTHWPGRAKDAGVWDASETPPASPDSFSARAEEWWKQNTPKALAALRRAVAYYRHSAEIGQENSVEIQQDNIRAFAQAHEIEIIHEFADRGKSGLNAEDRPAFNEMMEWVRTRIDFQLVLVLDVSRWGRFQDTDLSAHYESICTQHGKQVIYTNIGFTRDEDRLFMQLRKSIDRYQSAEYSRTLGKKVFDGAAKVARQGFWTGGAPPYGMYRLMLDENKKPDRVLQPGQRKAISNGRVTLVPGDKQQVEVVREIFALFAEKGLNARQIARILNGRKIPSPSDRQWNRKVVQNILHNRSYIGAVIYNKTSRRLKTKLRRNPTQDWVITPGAHEAIISPEIFERAQSIFNERRHRYDQDEMLRRLRSVYERYGLITWNLVRRAGGCPSDETYTAHFGSLQAAFQAMFIDVIRKAKDRVIQTIGQQVSSIIEHDDFLVIDHNFTILIQPVVPMLRNYEAHWTFRVDTRPVVDVTLGVLLSDDRQGEILGYLALPRLLMPYQGVQLTSTRSTHIIELHGHSGLDLIRELVT